MKKPMYEIGDVFEYFSTGSPSVTLMILYVSESVSADPDDDLYMVVVMPSEVPSDKKIVEHSAVTTFYGYKLKNYARKIGHCDISDFTYRLMHMGNDTTVVKELYVPPQVISQYEKELEVEKVKSVAYIRGWKEGAQFAKELILDTNKDDEEE